MSTLQLASLNINFNTIVIIACSILFVIWIFWNNPFRHSYINKNIVIKQQQKIENFQNAIAKTISNTRTTANTNVNVKSPNVKEIINSITLFQLYKDGVPDKYDANGNKISGIEPNAHKAIEYIRVGIRNGWGRWGLLELSKLLHYGIHNFDPDLEKAKQLYSYIIKTTKDTRLREEATSRYNEVDYNLNQLRVLDWLNLPNVHVKSASQSSAVAVPDDPTKLQDLHINRAQPVDVQYIIQQTNNDGEQIIVNTDEPNNVDVNVNVEARNPPPAQTIIRNDTQNVHDSTLLSTIRKAIENLQRAVYGDKLIPVENVLVQIRLYINSKPNNDKRKDAFKALDAIERNVVPLASTQLKEVEALQLVWSRIQSKDDIEIKEQLKDSIYNELAECIEHGKPVCSTGRFTRIIDSLNVMDDLVQIKPTFAIQQEMMNKCAKLRDDLRSTLSEEDVKTIDNDIDGTSDVFIQFDNKFKNTVKAEMKKDYVDTKIWTIEQLNKELNKWIDFI